MKARVLRRCALCSALIASSFLLTGCLSFQPAFFACILSGALNPSGCQNDLLSPGPPPAPTGLHVNVDGQLEWFPPAADAESYRIFASMTPGGPYQFIGFSPDEFFSASPLLEQCAVYYIVVIAVDHAGQVSEFSNEISYATECDAETPATKPKPPRDKGDYEPPGGGEPRRVIAPGHLASVARTGPSWFAFQLTVSGVYRSGQGRIDADVLTGSAYVVEGPFQLAVSFLGPLREPAFASATDARGTWRSRIDWRFDLRAGTGTSSGIALVTFAAPLAGKVCLRFEEAYAREGGATTSAHVTVHGNLTMIGGEGKAAALLGQGRYNVRVGADGSVVYQGRARSAQGAVPALPAECRALGGAP